MNSRKFLSLLLPLIAALTLTACVQDTASYIFPEQNHAITLMRNQTWLWQDKVNIDIIPMRLPDCHGGMQIKDVPRSNKLSFYAAPDDYPVPIFILQTGKRFYAISTLTCEVQKFDEAPANPGQLLGQFYEKDGKFQFVTSETMSDKPEKK